MAFTLLDGEVEFARSIQRVRMVGERLLQQFLIFAVSRLGGGQSFRRSDRGLEGRGRRRIMGLLQLDDAQD